MLFCFFFFFNDTATTEIYTLSLHDALPIFASLAAAAAALLLVVGWLTWRNAMMEANATSTSRRSEEHTSELQSPCNLVCRLLLEKKKNARLPTTTNRAESYSVTMPTRR